MIALTSLWIIRKLMSLCRIWKPNSRCNYKISNPRVRLLLISLPFDQFNHIQWFLLCLLMPWIDISNYTNMKTTHYTGHFLSAEGHAYKLEVDCFSVFQAFFLLTADAIRAGRHYQLDVIVDEDGSKTKVDDILKIRYMFN